MRVLWDLNTRFSTIHCVSRFCESRQEYGNVFCSLVSWFTCIGYYWFLNLFYRITFQILCNLAGPSYVFISFCCYFSGFMNWFVMRSFNHFLWYVLVSIPATWCPYLSSITMVSCLRQSLNANSLFVWNFKVYSNVHMFFLNLVLI